MENTRSYLPEIIISAVFTAIFAVCLFLTGAVFRFTTAFLISAAWLIMNVRARVRGKFIPLKKRISDSVVITAMLVIPQLVVSVFAVESHSLWRLPYQNALINFYHNVKMPEDVLPPYAELKSEVKSDYRFSYLGSVMQGTGHYTVSFTADTDYAKSVAAHFEDISADTFPLDGYSEPSDLAASDEPVLAVDRDFWNGREQGAVVYLLSHSGNVNHPHSTAVIVNTQSGAVSFSRLG